MTIIIKICLNLNKWNLVGPALVEKKVVKILTEDYIYRGDENNV